MDVAMSGIDVHHEQDLVLTEPLRGETSTNGIRDLSREGPFTGSPGTAVVIPRLRQRRAVVGLPPGERLQVFGVPHGRCHDSGSVFRRTGRKIQLAHEGDPPDPPRLNAGPGVLGVPAEIPNESTKTHPPRPDGAIHGYSPPWTREIQVRTRRSTG
jgi:hypothetical protein